MFLYWLPNDQQFSYRFAMDYLAACCAISVNRLAMMKSLDAVRPQYEVNWKP